MTTVRELLHLPSRNRELGLIALALLIATAGFAAVQLARAQEFSSAPLTAALLFAFAYLVAHAVVRECSRAAAATAAAAAALAGTAPAPGCGGRSPGP